MKPRPARDSLRGLYNAFVTSFTASTIEPAGKVTLGLHIGNLLKVILQINRDKESGVAECIYNFFPPLAEVVFKARLFLS